MRALPLHPGARGLADDAAVLEIGGEEIVLTHDTMIEGRHWLPGQDMADVAWKLIAANLSDLAAKGAEPLGVLIGHTLGEGDPRFVEGLHEVLEEYGIPLLGGDTVAGYGARTLGCTAIGRATHRPVPSRSGVQPWDELYLTGPVGAAMLGFENLKSQVGDSLAFRRPVPLLAEGQALAPHVNAMMDVSDGLLLDARRMAVASGVTFWIHEEAIPIAVAEARRDEALRWGDDYQLLFSVPDSIEPFAAPVPAWRIGEARPMLDEHPLLIDGLPPEPGDTLGYQHG